MITARRLQRDFADGFISPSPGSSVAMDLVLAPWCLNAAPVRSLHESAAVDDWHEQNRSPFPQWHLISLIRVDPCPDVRVVEFVAPVSGKL